MPKQAQTDTGQKKEDKMGYFMPAFPFCFQIRPKINFPKGKNTI